jgi:uncharacterized Zn finger protein (UPF0148 family)
MSPTLAVEEVADDVIEAESGADAPAFLREFCSICFTDNVSVRADGVIFCPECGHTSVR